MKVIWLSVLFWIGLFLGIAQERTFWEQDGKKSDVRIIVYEQGRRYVLVGREVLHGASAEEIGKILRYDIPEGLPAKRAIDSVLEEWDRVLVEAETSFCEGLDLDESQGEYVNLYLQVRPMNIPGTVASYRGVPVPNTAAHAVGSQSGCPRKENRRLVGQKAHK